jgi:colanic acid/amylovoran biosynthesis glycosyltransferase
MKPIVQFVSYDSPNDVGGVSSWLQRMVPRLREQGIDARVDLFCSENKPGVNAAWYRAHNVPFRLSRGQGDTRQTVRQCLRWLREDLPQVYVPNCILPAYFAAAEAKRCGARTIGVLHSDDPFYWAIVDEFVHGSEQWKLNELVTVSGFLHDAVQSSERSTIPVHKIPYGVPMPEARAAHATEKLRIVYTGRLVEEQKRISDLARAFCRVARHLTNLEAWIVGAGKDEATVRNIIKTESMEERVIVKGRVDPPRVHAVLSECQIFVLLSDYEGVPISLMEAMAVGLVPICLKTRSGVDEVISHMNNGIIVTDRENSLTDAVSYLVGNREALSKLSAAARRTISDRYSEERCVTQWRDLLLSRCSTVSADHRLKLHLKLPPRNRKFGRYDKRPNGYQKLRSRLQLRSRFLRTVSSTRRAALDLVRSKHDG